MKRGGNFMNGTRRRQWRRRLVGIVSTAMVAGGLGAVSGFADPAFALTVQTNVNVTRLAGNQAEGAIGVDPTNPRRVVTVANELAAGTGLAVGVSTDGGATWATRVIANGSDSLPAACCDPTVSWDSNGTLFVAYLDANVNSGAVHVLLSTDGGQSFSVVGNLDSGTSVDQPTITTGAGTVWVTWTSAADQVSASGAQITGFGTVSAFSTPERTGNGDFGDIAISPTGAVMVTYERPHDSTNPATLYTALDPDGLGPSGFNAESAVTSTNVGGFYSIPAQSARTVDAEAGLAWDRSGGPHNGRVYFIDTDTPSVGSADTNIFVRFSDNNGGTWSSPVRVNDDSTGNSQFLPRIAIDQTTGKLAVSWHDARNSAGNNTAQLWATTSDDGTSFAANVQVSAGTSNAATAASIIDFGDYTGLAYQDGVFYPFWADNSNSTGDNPDGAGHAFDMYTAAVIVTPPATSLTYTGATTSDFHDAFTASATLTQTAGGTPVGGATLTFTLGAGLAGETCTAVTNAAGSASCTLTPQEAAGPTTLTVSFAGNASVAASSATVPFTITKEETTLTYTGPTLFPTGNNVTFSALLREDGTVPIAGRTVTITIGTGAGAQSCSGTTDATGTASCTILVNQPLGPGLPITATFAGDAFYLGSSASATALVFAFLDHGTFAVGDGSAAIGSTATFWGARWASVNVLSGGAAPNSFKGFAATTSTTPPSCGGSYTGSPGNSSGPPDSLPSYLGVAVSSQVTQSGSAISGNVVHIVVIHTDPGYAPNPGHPGTGTVVAQFC
jgi:hypothetical protein